MYVPSSLVQSFLIVSIASCPTYGQHASLNVTSSLPHFLKNLHTKSFYARISPPLPPKFSMKKLLNCHSKINVHFYKKKIYSCGAYIYTNNISNGRDHWTLEMCNKKKTCWNLARKIYMIVM